MAALLLGSLLLAVQARPASADGAVTIDPNVICAMLPCVSMPSVAVHGTFVDLTFDTTKAAIPLVEVSTQAPGPGPSYSGMQVTSSAFPFFAGYRTHHVVRVSGIEAKTAYHFLITAKDQGGTKAARTGTFTTLTRQVTVHFNAIKVIDDSDGGFNGAGDLTFFFNVNGTWDPALKYGEVSVSSGDTAHPGKTKVVNNASDVLSIQVQGKDDDCDWFGDFCPNGVGPYSEEFGSEADVEWATANSGIIALPADGPDEVVTGHAFTVSTTSYALKFQVMGTYDVKYA